MAALASASNDEEMIDYSQEELDQIIGEVEKYEREMENESDIEVGSDVEEDSEDESDPECDRPIPLVALQTTWRPATRGVADVRQFQGRTGLTRYPTRLLHSIFSFCLYLIGFFRTAADETNRYARQKQAANGARDPLWCDTTPEEMRAYVAVLIMMGVKRLPRLWCYWSDDPVYTDEWISSVMPKNRFFKLNQYFHLRDSSNIPVFLVTAVTVTFSSE